MKCLQRCSISGSFGDLEIPLLWTIFYSLNCVEAMCEHQILKLSGIVRGEGVPQGSISLPLLPQSSLSTFSGGEFGWGGTSVKR